MDLIVHAEPVIKLSAERFPFVRVPVLSVKRIFILPAASIPTGLRTSTISRTILLIFEDRTTAIIIGKPSGTAIIITVRARVSEWSISENKNDGSYIFDSITSFEKSLCRTIVEKRSASATRIAAAYPRRLICFASFASRTLRGLSRVES